MYNAVTNVNVTVQHTLITEHIQKVGLISFNPLLTGLHLLTLRNVTVSRNKIADYGFGPVLVYGPVEMTIDSCQFTDNTGFISTLSLSDVNGFFEGETQFVNNHGGFGGGLHLSDSTLWFSNTSKILFKNNKAYRFGGGLFIQEFGSDNLLNELISPPTNEKCFYQLLHHSQEENDTQATMIFENNTAQEGGDDIFGAALKDDCLVSDDELTTSSSVYQNNFVFRNNTLSRVSSNPTRICLCDVDGRRPQCADLDYIFRDVSAIIGETFTLSVVVVGADFGTVTGNVHASILNQESDHRFGLGQETYEITSTMCEDRQYSIHSKSEQDQVQFLLSIDSDTASAHRTLLNNNRRVFNKRILGNSINTYHNRNIIGLELLTAPVIVDVTLLPCPLGFDLLGGPLYVCQCTEFLQDYVDLCNITNGTGLFHLKENTWLGYFQNETNGTDGLQVSRYCNTGYCDYENIGIDLYNPDSQCAFNRQGRLCGGCLLNYSLALGSSRCIRCENSDHAALLLVFIAAGIALVLFIKILDLTVSQGTINGLIFYANVIWLHRTTFISVDNDDIDPHLVQFLQITKVFIAWLNLDLGIETCFIEGLNAYAKTWLQFVFPIYIWFLAGGIIFICRYSTKLTRLFGNNAVSVLATLFSLSYLKVLRNSITIITFTYVFKYHCEGVEAISVWAEDGNLLYFGLEHSLLAITCLLFMVFLWIPYTAILLLAPLLRMSDKPFFSWVNKMSPFFDAYYGPLKPRHRYWVGMELVIGAALPAVGSISEETTLSTIIVVTAFLCVLSTYVYRMWYNTLLHILFLFNLLVVTTAFIATSDLNTRAVCVSVSILFSFIIFLGIVLFHSYTALNKYFSLSKSRTSTITKPVKPVKPVTTHQTIALRETLLETCIA